MGTGVLDDGFVVMGVLGGDVVGMGALEDGVGSGVSSTSPLGSSSTLLSSELGWGFITNASQEMPVKEITKSKRFQQSIKSEAYAPHIHAPCAFGPLRVCTRTMYADLYVCLPVWHRTIIITAVELCTGSFLAYTGSVLLY